MAPNVVHNGSQVTDANGNLVDLDGKTIVGGFKDKRPPFTDPATSFNPGFPGFNPTASESLAYVADMQEAGIPVTYAYISDVHDKKTPNGSTTKQVCPGNPRKCPGAVGGTCYKDNLAAYDASFQKFFTRLAADGITKKNTLFVFSSEENDHFAGSNVSLATEPVCTGAAGTISYTCTLQRPPVQAGRRSSIERAHCWPTRRATPRRSTARATGRCDLPTGGQSSGANRQLEARLWVGDRQQPVCRRCQ